MNVSFRPEAEDDFREAAEYYLAINPEVGRNFVIEIRKAIADIQNRPFLRPVVSRGLRRELVPRYSFGIYYVCLNDEINIRAIMHLTRHPSRWKRRGS